MLWQSFASRSSERLLVSRCGITSAIQRQFVESRHQKSHDQNLLRQGHGNNGEGLEFAGLISCPGPPGDGTNEVLPYLGLDSYREGISAEYLVERAVGPGRQQ